MNIEYRKLFDGILSPEAVNTAIIYNSTIKKKKKKMS